MSSRALRKAQKQQEQQQRLEEIEDAQQESPSEEEPVSKAKASIFAMLDDGGGQEDDEDEDEEQKHSTEDSVNQRQQPSTSQSASIHAGAKRKKKKKKGKGGSMPKQAVQKEDSDDSLDAALADLKLQKPDADELDPSSGKGGFNALLAINVQNLHVLNEMRKLFGSDAVEAERREIQQASRGRGHAAGTNRLAALARRRNIFIQGKEDWPSAPSGGLGMEVVEKRPDGVVEYRFVHSTNYQETQSRFDVCVASMDPQRLVMMLQTDPYHISTLLQVSEIAKHQRDNSGAGELLERALFSFGRSVHSTFLGKLNEGKARLSFLRFENREFALAIWRYIENLKLRATWRTVYEWAKLLYSMDPVTDPYCMALVLDQYALRAHQADHLVQLSASLPFQTLLQSYGNPTPFYGLEASVALALLQTDRAEEASTKLKSTIVSHPWLYSGLFRELQIEPLPPAIWGKVAPDDADDLLTSIYVARAKDVWNTPEAMAFLINTTKAIQPSKDASEASPAVQECFAEEAFVRHVVLSDNPTWVSRLPVRPSEDQLLSGDPIPPADSIDDTYGVPADRLRTLETLLSALRQYAGPREGDNDDANGVHQPQEDLD